MSSCFCPVVRVTKFGKNPNSDKLMIWNGPHGPVQFGQGSIQPNDLAMYVPVDHVVDTSIKEFNFLADKADHEGKYRVKPVSLRGLPSVGLLIPLNGQHHFFTPSNSGIARIIQEGDDMSPYFWIEKAESKDFVRGNDSEVKSPLSVPKYDVQGYQRVAKDIPYEARNLNDEWSMTEKIHGANMKFVLHDGKTIIGSRSQWKNVDGSGEFSRAYKKNQKAMDEIASNHPNVVFYGEAYGQVQDIKYGKKDVDIALFDAYDFIEDRWWSPAELVTMLVALGYSNMYVPIVHSMICCTFEEAVTIAKSEFSMRNGRSMIDDKSIMEGIVIRPRNFGRPIAKVVNPQYLTRKGGTEFS